MLGFCCSILAALFILFSTKERDRQSISVQKHKAVKWKWWAFTTYVNANIKLQSCKYKYSLWRIFFFFWNTSLGKLKKKGLNKVLTKDWRLFSTFVGFLYYNNIWSVLRIQLWCNCGTILKLFSVIGSGYGDNCY